jgi:hypothetical protein
LRKGGGGHQQSKRRQQRRAPHPAPIQFSPAPRAEPMVGMYPPHRAATMYGIRGWSRNDDQTVGAAR